MLRGRNCQTGVIQPRTRLNRYRDPVVQSRIPECTPKRCGMYIISGNTAGPPSLFVPPVAFPQHVAQDQLLRKKRKEIRRRLDRPLPRRSVTPAPGTCRSLPSDILKLQDWGEYWFRYLDEIHSLLDPDAVLRDLLAATAGFGIILIFFEKDRSHCPGTGAAWFREKQGFIVPGIGVDPAQRTI
jgi:hypothetical protein